MSKFEAFQQAYDNAIETIGHFQTDDECIEMRGLVEWLLTTDANPYAFLPEVWAGSFSTAEGFASLLNYIHHAVYDDGDIAFVSVDGEPRIVFTNRHEEGIRDFALSDQEKQIEKRPIFGCTRDFEVVVLDITPNEFGTLYDAFQLKWLQECFAADAGRNGIEFALPHYEKYACFSPDWVDICADEIAKWDKFYTSTEKIKP